MQIGQAAQAPADASRRMCTNGSPHPVDARHTQQRLGACMPLRQRSRCMSWARVGLEQKPCNLALFTRVKRELLQQGKGAVVSNRKTGCSPGRRRPVLHESNGHRTWLIGSAPVINLNDLGRVYLPGSGPQQGLDTMSMHGQEAPCRDI